MGTATPVDRNRLRSFTLRRGPQQGGDVRLVSILLDTNVLVRLANAADNLYPTADRGVSELHLRGEVVYITAQILIEFRNVATRPMALNGLGLSTAEAESKA